MSEDGEKDQDKDEETRSRPATASARRKRRSSEGSATGKSTRGSDSAGRPVPKGKSSAGSRATASRASGAGKTEGKSEPTPKRGAKPKQGSSLFARVVRFLREVWGELKKVVWPTRKQMGTYTVVVFAFLAFMIALVFGLDFVFNEAVTLVFGK